MFKHFHNKFFTEQQPYQSTSKGLSLGAKRSLLDMTEITLSVSTQHTHRQAHTRTHTHDVIDADQAFKHFPKLRVKRKFL